MVNTAPLPIVGRYARAVPTPRHLNIGSLVPRNPLQRGRFLWFGIAWAACALFVVLGSTYLLGGLSATVNGRGYVIVVGFFRPIGGMRFHGGLMLGVGILLAYALGATLYGLPEPRGLLKWTTRFVWAEQAWCAIAFWLAPLAHGKLSIGAATWWTVAAVVTWLLVKFPPATKDEVQWWQRQHSESSLPGISQT